MDRNRLIDDSLKSLKLGFLPTHDEALSLIRAEIESLQVRQEELNRTAKVGEPTPRGLRTIGRQLYRYKMALHRAWEIERAQRRH